MTESSNSMRDKLLSDHGKVRAKFVEHFKAEIEQLAARLDIAFARLGELDQKVQNDRRAAWEQAFLHLGLNNVLTAGQLIVVGLLQPAGNLMRVFGESVAMALLISHPEIGVFERIEEDPARFPFHKAIGMVCRKENLERLEIQPNAWRELEEISKWFDGYSHASTFAVATLRNFSRGGMILGSEFDDEKVDEYRKLLVGCISSAKLLVDFAERNISRTEKGE